jgi:nucleoside diphosphate kinase
VVNSQQSNSLLYVLAKPDALLGRQVGTIALSLRAAGFEIFESGTLFLTERQLLRWNPAIDNFPDREEVVRF